MNLLVFFMFFQHITYSADEVWLELKDEIRVINARKDVKIEGEDFLIISDSAIIYETQEPDSAYLLKNSKIIFENYKISAKKIFYDFKKKLSVFDKDISIISDTFEIKTSKIFYYEVNDSAYAPFDVYFSHKRENIYIEGKELIYFTKSQRGILKKLKRVKLISEKDTVEIKGKMLFIFKRNFKILDSVKIRGNQLTGYCDTLLWRRDSVLLKGKENFLKFKDSYLKGKEIRIHMKDGKIKKVVSIEDSFLRAFIEEEKDTLFMNSNILYIFLDDSLKLKSATAKGEIKGRIKGE